MKELSIAALAVALAAVWAVGPALAQTTSDQAPRTSDKVEGKGESTMDKVKEKAREAKEKIKEKATQAKEKISATTQRAKEKVEAKSEKMDVKAAQQSLRDHGFDPGPIDGIHGPRTTAAVRQYQKAQGLTVNGHLDSATTARLNVPSATPSASPATDARTDAPAGKPQSD